MHSHFVNYSSLLPIYSTKSVNASTLLVINKFGITDCVRGSTVLLSLHNMRGSHSVPHRRGRSVRGIPRATGHPLIRCSPPERRDLSGPNRDGMRSVIAGVTHASEGFFAFCRVLSSQSCGQKFFCSITFTKKTGMEEIVQALYQASQKRHVCRITMHGEPL